MKTRALHSLVLLLALMLPAQVRPWSEHPESEDDDHYYELTYTQCAYRYASSAYSEATIDCLCARTAAHALKWRKESPDRIPPLPDSAENDCLHR